MIFSSSPCSSLPVGGTALAACVAHGLRLAGWRGLAVRRNPLVFAMHVAYAWLIVAFALAAAAPLGLGVAPRAWIHAFTIGAVGTMMLALMPRVSLRHTGRALVLSRLMRAALPAMSIAALLRLAVAFSYGRAWAWDWKAGALAGAALLWALCFGAYLAVHGPSLVRSSRPRAVQPG